MMKNPIQILLSDEALSVSDCLSAVSSKAAGGIALFVGSVRDITGGRKVVRLEFEAYKPMAVKEMEKIACRAMEEYDLEGIAIHHALGVLEPGELPVIIAAAAAHRDAAFKACRYAIDRLKQTVPIWKKEVYEDGEVWVSAHP